MKAKTHWVWTHKAERDSRGRNRAGTLVHDMWREEVPAFVIEQKLAVDASEFDYGDGQVDLLELL